jgi:hypothetical protein
MSLVSISLKRLFFLGPIAKTDTADISPGRALPRFVYFFLDRRYFF